MIVLGTNVGRPISLNAGFIMPVIRTNTSGDIMGLEIGIEERVCELQKASLSEMERSYPSAKSAVRSGIYLSRDNQGRSRSAGYIREHSLWCSNFLFRVQTF